MDFINDNIKTINEEKLDNLSAQLASFIKNKKDFFNTTEVIFPGNEMIQYFKAYWLKHENHVLMNLSCFTLSEGLLRYFNNNHYGLASSSQIRTILIKLIASDNNLAKQIKDYVYNNNALDSIRIYDFAASLSKIFTDYDNDDFPLSDWQKKLYESLIKELNGLGLTTFRALLDNDHDIKKSDEEIIFFGFSKLKPLFKRATETIASVNKVTFYQLALTKDNLVKTALLTSPSRLREIETVHSEICHLILDEGARYSDFLVLAPSINNYVNEISRVFNQDNETFAEIKYGIASSSTEEGEVTVGLKKLEEIVLKGFYTRLDFVSLLHNKVIASARNLSEDDASAMIDGILSMNVFRNGKTVDDWEYAKTRMVLSLVSNPDDEENNLIELKDNVYTPFSTIDLNHEVMIKFIKMIDDLSSFMKLGQNKTASASIINQLKDELGKWFSIKNEAGNEINKTYLKLSKELEFWINNDLDKLSLPLNTLFYTLNDLSMIRRGKKSVLFNDGISFASLSEDTILSAEYVFIIGLSSKEYPVIRQQSEIDYNSQKESIKEQYDYFELQCKNANSKLYLSYVNKNLKSDEDFYPSTFVNSLNEKYSLDFKHNVINTEVDETRSYKDLFTKKEFKEKSYFNKLFKNSDAQIEEINFNEVNKDNKISISSIKNFLSEPLKYKYTKLFGYADETKQNLNNEYEPLDLDNLERSNLIKIMILYFFNNKDQKVIDENNEIDYLLTEEIFKRFITDHKIPKNGEIFEKELLNNLVKESYNDYQMILKKAGDNYKIRKVSDIKLKDGEDEITLVYDDEFCFSENKDGRNYIELSSLPSRNFYDTVLKMYLVALMDVSLLSGGEYVINISKGGSKGYSFSISPDQSKDLLINIYKAMNDYTFNVLMPLNEINKNPKTIDNLIYEFSHDMLWKSFNDSKSFSDYQDFGYNQFTYKETLSRIKELIRNLVLYLPEEKKDEGEDNGE